MNRLVFAPIMGSKKDERWFPRLCSRPLSLKADRAQAKLPASFQLETVAIDSCALSMWLVAALRRCSSSLATSPKPAWAAKRGLSTTSRLSAPGIAPGL